MDHHHLAELDALMRAGPGHDVITVAEIVAELLHRPDWHAEAACRGRGDEVAFFPALGQSTAPAKALCATCPVTAQCAAFALDTGAFGGIWAGETSANLRKARRTAA